MHVFAYKKLQSLYWHWNGRPIPEIVHRNRIFSQIKRSVYLLDIAFLPKGPPIPPPNPPKPPTPAPNPPRPPPNPPTPRKKI
jgi:hypothetical protein